MKKWIRIKPWDSGELYMKKTNALGRGLGALIGRKNLEDPSDSAEKQAMSKEFYGSLLKKYVQGGRKDKTLEGLMSDVRVHLNVSEEEHQHLISTLEKREKTAPVGQSEDVWKDLQKEMQDELSDMFNEFRESEGMTDKKIKDHDRSSKEPIALPERSINVVKGPGEGTIEAPPAKEAELAPQEETSEEEEKDLFDYGAGNGEDEVESIPLEGEVADLDEIPEAESLEEEEEVPEMDVIPMPPKIPEPKGKGMDIVYDEEIPLEEMEGEDEILEKAEDDDESVDSSNLRRGVGSDHDESVDSSYPRESIRSEGIHSDSDPEEEPEPVQKPKEKKGTLGDLRIMMDEDRIEEALALSEKLMEEDEYSYEVLNERGVLLYHTGDINGSIKCYERALELNPESLEAVVNYATLLAGKGEIDKSLRLLSDAVEKNPYSEEAWNNKAVVLAHIGRNREALECLDQSVRINERSVETWTNTAVILEKLEEYGPAYECYTRILDLNPDNETARKGQEYCRMHK